MAAEIQGYQKYFQGRQIYYGTYITLATWFIKMQVMTDIKIFG